MRTVLLDAAQSSDYKCLSPLAVLDELDELCERDARVRVAARRAARRRLPRSQAVPRGAARASARRVGGRDAVASGLVDEIAVRRALRSVRHARQRVGEKGEGPEPRHRRVRGPRRADDARGRGAPRREGRCTPTTGAGSSRAIAAWAIDHPGKKIENAVVFAAQTRKLRDAVFAERRKHVALLRAT